MKVKATRLIDDRSYPEMVLCEIVDVNGYKHKFKEKVDSYIVSTLQPWAIESIEVRSFFEIRKDLLFEMNG